MERTEQGRKTRGKGELKSLNGGFGLWIYIKATGFIAGKQEAAKIHFEGGENKGITGIKTHVATWENVVNVLNKKIIQL